jgi:hypothetical protein
LFYPKFVIVQEYTVVTRLYKFFVMRESGFPTLFALGGIDITGGRHESDTGKHPAMHLRES